jgi:hypothetical protein
LISIYLIYDYFAQPNVTPPNEVISLYQWIIGILIAFIIGVGIPAVRYILKLHKQLVETTATVVSAAEKVTIVVDNNTDVLRVIEKYIK